MQRSSPPRQGVDAFHLVQQVSEWIGHFHRGAHIGATSDTPDTYVLLVCKAQRLSSQLDLFRAPSHARMKALNAHKCLSALFKGLCDTPRFANHPQASQALLRLQALVGHPITCGVDVGSLQDCLSVLAQALSEQAVPVYLDLKVSVEPAPQALQVLLRARLNDHRFLSAHLPSLADNPDIGTVDALISVVEVLDDELNNPQHHLDLGIVGPDELNAMIQLGIWNAFMERRLMLRPSVSGLALSEGFTAFPNCFAQFRWITELRLPDFAGTELELRQFPRLQDVYFSGDIRSIADEHLHLPAHCKLNTSFDMDLSD